MLRKPCLVVVLPAAIALVACTGGGGGGADAAQDPLPQPDPAVRDEGTPADLPDGPPPGDLAPEAPPDIAADTVAKPRCEDCHSVMAARIAGGSHKGLAGGCLTCHANGLIHQEGPKDVRADVDFSVEQCGKCHLAHKESWLKADGTKPGHFGGSVKTSKYDEFPHYVHLMGGHGFTKEYNEERSHSYMLKDHIEIKRKQNVVCLQCKSTPVAYYWNEPRRGEMVFSKDMAWDAGVAKIKEMWPKTGDYGAGCTHCHDPHATRFRLVRRAQVAAILERGTDPYDAAMNTVPKSPAELEDLMNERDTKGEPTDRARRLAGTLTCAQCHVEYTCGPGIDKDLGILRDDFPWRKLKDLEAYYKVKYDLVQDWKHSVTGLPGIKAQHPETELYWGSTHHLAGLSCADCHMARQAEMTSHWATSPLKQPAATCGRCHGKPDEKVAQTLASQDKIASQARAVEDALEEVLLGIEAEAANPAADAESLAKAKDRFMRALLWWEFSVVSENSMGLHNEAEVATNLDFALDQVLEAKGLLGL